jgi:hypothetical protein
MARRPLISSLPAASTLALAFLRSAKALLESPEQLAS